MEPLHKLIVLFGALYPFRITSGPRLNSLKYSPLKVLPIELIMSIAESLPLQVAVSFTLTCRPVWNILGNHYLDQLKTEGHKPDRLAFLELLERDIPQQILCYDCKLLHNGAKRRYNSRWDAGESPRCLVRDLTSHVQYYIQNGFCSVTFQSAMKLHCHGLDCSEQLSLLTGFGSPYARGYNHQWTSVPRIINGHFILRHQDWLLFPVGYELIVPDRMYKHVCPHWEFGSRRSRGWSELKTKLHCQINYWNNLRLNLRCPVCSGLFQCKICPTEFQIDIKDFLKNGVALIVTRWLDLGEGRSLSDPRYASHVLRRYCLRSPDTPVSFEPGSIKAAYEEENFDVEKLLTPKHTFDLFWTTPL